MKPLPLIRNLGIALAVIPIAIWVAGTIWKFNALRNPRLAAPFSITVGLGIVVAIIAQKNMPAKDAYRFEK